MTVETSVDTAPVIRAPEAARGRSWFELYGSISQRRRLLLGIAGGICLLLVWTLATRMGLASPRLLPSPLQVATSLVNLLRDGFLSDILQSVYRICFSFLLAVLVAYPLGLLIGTSASISAFLSPVVSAFRYLPAPAFVPLLLMWLGTGDDQKIALLFLGVVWFLVTVIADHVRGVRRELVETARTLGASNLQLYLTVIAPASWPRVWDALRQMLAVSWTYLVIAEIVAATDGIGAMMMRAQRFVRVDDVMAGIVTIGILGVGFDLLFRLIGKYLFAYETIEQEAS